MTGIASKRTARTVVLSLLAALALPVVVTAPAQAAELETCKALSTFSTASASTTLDPCAPEVPTVPTVDVCELLGGLKSAWTVSTRAYATCLPDVPDIPDVPDVCSVLKSLASWQAKSTTAAYTPCIPPLPPVPPVPPVPDLCDLIRSLASTTVSARAYTTCLPPVPNPCDATKLDPCTPPPLPDVCEVLASLTSAGSVRMSASTVDVCLPPIPPIPPVPPVPPVPVPTLDNCADGQTVIRAVTGTYLVTARYVDANGWTITRCFLAAAAVPVPIVYEETTGRAVTTQLDVANPTAPAGAKLTITRTNGACDADLKLTATVNLPGIGVVTTGYDSPITPTQFIADVQHTPVADGNRINVGLTQNGGCAVPWTKIPVLVERASGGPIDVSARFSPMPSTIQAAVVVPSSGDVKTTSISLTSPYAVATEIDASIGNTVVNVDLSTTWGTTQVAIVEGPDDQVRVNYDASRVLGSLDVHIGGATTVDAVATNVPTQVRLCLDKGSACPGAAQQYDDFSLGISGSGPITLASLNVVGDNGDLRVSATNVGDLNGLTFHQGSYWQDEHVTCVQQGELQNCTTSYGPREPLPMCAQRVNGHKVDYIAFDTGGRHVAGDIDILVNNVGCESEDNKGVIVHSPSPGFKAGDRQMYWSTEPFAYWTAPSHGSLSCPYGFTIDVRGSNGFIDGLTKSIACT